MAPGSCSSPPTRRRALALKALIERIVAEEGQRVLGWRAVPIDLGSGRRQRRRVSRRCSSRSSSKPSRRPTVAATRARCRGPVAFERKLYVIRKRVEHEVEALELPADARKAFYIVSLSANTLIYKGMLTASQIEGMFPDLSNPAVESALALVHQRFSTNTFPSWPLAHPYRYVAHNGEINTLRGNINWMRAREGLLQLERVRRRPRARCCRSSARAAATRRPSTTCSSSWSWPAASLPHAVLMMIPEPWGGNPAMDPAVRAFYEYHSSLMEPWDGPASIAFTDGTLIGAVLDRNGLRPSRYCVTERRPRDHGVGGRRARHPRRSHRRQGSAAPGQDAADRHRRRAASSATRRSSSGLAAEQPVRRVAAAAPRRHRGAAARVRRAARPSDGAAAAAGVRLHAGGSRGSC